jgi:phosphoribosylformylglycinamidine synthase
MTPYEILLSESQERMLVVAEPGRVADIEAVCAKWELTCATVGRVTDDGLFRVVHDGITVAAIPGKPLVDECPVYHPAAREAPAAAARRASTPARPDVPPAEALLALLDSPTVASKRWVYEQYDSTVQGCTALGPGGDAGVFTVPGERFGIAVKVDCNGRHVALDPYEGGKGVVAEAARNIACTGAVPLGITDCLNFGNPEKPEVFYQFREACRGIADACLAFDTPVTGGNVSFYNESPTGAIDPTPTVGMVGLLTDVRRRTGAFFTTRGDLVAVVGYTRGHLGGSSYWADVLGHAGGAPPPVNLDHERRLQRFLADAATEGVLRSAHDCADGGLAVAVAEACMGEPYAVRTLGAALDLRTYAPGLSPQQLLFGEDHGRVVLSLPWERRDDLARLARRHGVPLYGAGRVTAPGSALTVRLSDVELQWDPAALRAAYYSAIPRRMAAVATSTGEGG